MKFTKPRNTKGSLYYSSSMPQIYIIMFYYQQITQQISLIHTHKRQLPHVSAIPYCTSKEQ